MANPRKLKPPKAKREPARCFLLTPGGLEALVQLVALGLAQVSSAGARGRETRAGVILE